MEKQNLSPFSIYNNNTAQKVFIWMNIEHETLAQSTNAKSESYLSFQLEVMYQAKSSVSEKLKLETEPVTCNTANASSK